MQVYSNPYYPAEPLPESDSIALAKIDIEGVVSTINSTGNALWGWKNGEQIPDSTLRALFRDDPQISIPDSNGEFIETTCVSQQDGWLLVGKTDASSLRKHEKSSIKTLIENTPAFHQSFTHLNPQGILFLDRAGQVLYCNQRFKELSFLGSEHCMPGKSYLSLNFDSTLTLKVQHLLQERIATFQHSVMQDDSDETIDELSIFGTPVFDTNNSILGAILSFETRQSHDETVSHADVLVKPARHMAQLQNMFVAMMSHEIRTPLGVMNGYAEILGQELVDYENQTGTSLPPQIKEFVDAIHENTQRILGLVNELFDLSNMRQLRLTPIRLHDCLRPVLESTRLALQNKGVQFDLELADEDLVVLSNPNRLSQIIHNLLSNAVKFTHDGTVTLRTRSAEDTIIIEIVDTGVGISQEYLNQLFTPFVQEDMGLNRKFEGAGLGLAMVKLLLDLMKGRIEVQSEKGKGSTFTIFLPIP